MLGWNIYKLWSPDWWDNPQRVLQDIVDAINEALINKNNIVEDSENISPKPASEIIVNQLANQAVSYYPQPSDLITNDYTIYNSYDLEKNSLYNSDEFF